MNEPVENVVPEPEAGARPGALLRLARIDLGLGIEQVSQRLRLPPKLIAALEEDDYAGLPGSTYVRGYLRAYANTLGTPPEPVLAAHARLIGHSAPANLGKLAVTGQVTSRHQHIRLTTYLVIAVIFGLSIAWWQAREGRHGGGDVAAVGTPTAADTPSDLQNGQAPGPESQPAQAPVMNQGPARTALSAAPPPAPAQTVPVGNGLASLTIYADQESWTDIRDAEERRLLYESLPAGRTVSLQGIPPFSIYLGNVQGVRLELNGQAQDLEKYRPGPIARFRLGEQTRAPTLPAPP